MDKHFYITTAIDYANGKPHIGHAYEKILADVMARTKRMEGYKVHFLTGLDEHGQKVEQTAKRQKIEPKQWCDQIALAFQDLLGQLNISNDQYIRTTDAQHKKTVHTILQTLFEKNQFYKAEYKGFYSTKEEQFLQEKDQVDGKWPEHYGEVVEIAEPNYFFKLSEHADWLAAYIEKNPTFIFPQYRAKQVLEFLKEGINDLCISRPKDRLSWGIPLPFDEQFVTFVWFDALINYISAIGWGTPQFQKHWPADSHIIGKDILLPAHAIYWPIMLKVLDLPLPKQLVVHGWWLNSGEKMSKSKGNSVDPLSLVRHFGEDPFRYYLIREMNVGQDCDFSLERFLVRYNTELANDLGNLVSRILNMTKRYCGGENPKASIEEDPEETLFTLWAEVFPKIIDFYDELQFSKGLEKLFEFIRAINRYAELRAPWKLAKSEDLIDQQRLETAIAYMAEGLRLSSLLLFPVMPTIAEKIWQLLSIKEPERWKEALKWGHSMRHNTFEQKCILFPKIELESVLTAQ